MAGSRSRRKVEPVLYHLSHEVLTGYSRNVALKIIRADRTSDSKEQTILQRLKAPDAEEPLVIQLLDVFEHASPNGTHQVLVMEPVHPIDFMRYSVFRPIFTREAVHQTIQGLAFIHNRGIAHGGLLLALGCRFYSYPSQISTLAISASRLLRSTNSLTSISGA